MNPVEEQIKILLGRISALEGKVAELEVSQSSEWVKLWLYCRLTGDTKDAVYSRRHSGKWADGVHCKITDGKLWINVPEAQRWVKKNQNISRAA